MITPIALHTLTDLESRTRVRRPRLAGRCHRLRHVPLKDLGVEWEPDGWSRPALSIPVASYPA